MSKYQINSRIAMRIKHERGESPLEMLTRRTAELCAHLPANELGRIVLSDDNLLRSIAIAASLRYYGCDVAISQNCVKGATKEEKQILSDSKIELSEGPWANVKLFGDEGSVHVQEVRQMMVFPQARWNVDASFVYNVAIASNNDPGWRNGTMDIPLYFTKIILSAVRKALGEAIGYIFKQRRRLSGMMKIVIRPYEQEILLPPDIKAWYRKLAINGYDITADKRLVEQLSIRPPADNQYSDITWDSFGPIITNSEGSLRIVPSGSILQIVQAAMLKEKITFGIAPTPFSRDSCDVVITGKGAQIIQKKIAKEGHSAKIINSEKETMPRARVFVAADNSAKSADLALSALFAGIVPVLPAGMHSALWAIPSFVAYICNCCDPDDLTQLSKGIISCNSRVFDNWSIRGKEIWRPIFCVPTK